MVYLKEPRFSALSLAELHQPLIQEDAAST